MTRKIMQPTYNAYKKEIEYLYSLQKFGIKFGLSTTSQLLESLGNPHQGQNYIHIAGTNGKGSVATFLSTIFQKQGFKVGLYTSPHLVRFTERFQINSREIGQEQACRLIQRLRQVFIPDEPPTFFEATTALALFYFALEKTDIAIIEVGMGGRLDATNIIDPLISIITNISMEHQDFLGDNLLDIAYEKAGIIKENVPVVTGVQDSSVIALFQKICEQSHSPLYQLGRDFSLLESASGFDYHGLCQDLENLHISLTGQHQKINASLALAVTEILKSQGIEIFDKAIQKGLQNSVWPGRMQIVCQKPLILLDGAHNPQAIHTLAASLKKEFEFHKCFLVIGTMVDKDINSILAGIMPQADYVIFTRPKYERAIDPEQLMELAKPWQKPGQAIQSLPQALDTVHSLARDKDIIVLCGSLFLVGEALTYYDPVNYCSEF